MTQTINKIEPENNLHEWISRYPDFREQIKILRHFSGMTQAQLADKVERTPRSIRTIENNEANPRITTLGQIAAALNADLIIALVPRAEIPLVEKIVKQGSVQLAREADIDVDPDLPQKQTEVTFPRRDIQIGETD